MSNVGRMDGTTQHAVALIDDGLGMTQIVREALIRIPSFNPTAPQNIVIRHLLPKSLLDTNQSGYEDIESIEQASFQDLQLAACLIDCNLISHSISFSLELCAKAIEGAAPFSSAFRGVPIALITSSLEIETYRLEANKLKVPVFSKLLELRELSIWLADAFD